VVAGEAVRAGVRGQDEHSVVEHDFVDEPGRWDAKLDAEKEASAAHLANEVQPAHRVLELVPQGRPPLGHALD
jgi:hypothetical protein